MPKPLEKIRQQIIERIRIGLDPRFVYHNLQHTLDVMKQAELIALSEGFQPGHDIELLKLAAAYHDSGFLIAYKHHEEKGCGLFKNDTAGYLSSEDSNIVCGMIMATRIPQSPGTLLEKIICDADLDYLGRDDFETISQNLYKEFIDFEIIKSEDNWNEIQINFFETHNYFTNTSNKNRNASKQEHLLVLKGGSYKPS